jgi:hypothetical protein
MQFGSRCCALRAGWPWRLPARAPTDPDVRALAHPVPRPTGSPSVMVPEAIRSSCGDMRENLDVFSMFPSIRSAGRRFAFLHRVLRGEFPCFDGTIKALRLPAARPAALRCLRLAVPQRSLVLFAPRRTSAPPKPGVGHPVSPAGMSLRRRQDLPSSWGTPLSVCHVQSTPAGLLAPDRYSAAAWPLVCEKQRLPRRVFRRSIAWLSDSLSTLRRAGYPASTQDSLPAVGQTLLDGLLPAGSHRKVSECFPYISSSFPKLCLAQSHRPAH